MGKPLLLGSGAGIVAYRTSCYHPRRRDLTIRRAFLHSSGRITSPLIGHRLLPVDREDLEADEQAAPPRGELHAELQRGHQLDRDLAHALGRPTPLRSAVASRVELLQEGVVGLLRA